MRDPVDSNHVRPRWRGPERPCPQLGHFPMSPDSTPGPKAPFRQSLPAAAAGQVSALGAGTARAITTGGSGAWRSDTCARGALVMGIQLPMFDP